MKKERFKKLIRKRWIYQKYRAWREHEDILKPDAVTAGAAAVSFGRKKTAWIMAAAAFLLLFILSAFSSCGAMFAGGGGMTMAGSYLSEPAEIDAAELAYTQLERELQETIDRIESDHPDYDEYRYNIGEIGHSPFSLIGILSAKNTEFTADDITSQLRDIFNGMYRLSLRHVVETRTRTETRTGHRRITHTDGSVTEEDYEYDVEVEYQVDILETTLAVTPMDTVAATILDSEQQELYAAYGETHGGLQQFASPLDLYWYNYVSSYYGYRKNPDTGDWELHNGIDIAVPEGSDVYTGHDGTVTETGYDSYWGNYVCIMDGDGFLMKYAHLSEISVSQGQGVTMGTVIGRSGSTGTCTESHLHLEVSQGGIYYNPIFYFDVESATLYGESAGDTVSPPQEYDDEAVARLMEEAAKYVGRRYVWGGSKPSTGFDCSGYVCWCYTQSGFCNLPRTTAQGIYNRCTAVAASEARAGDLVFFTGTYRSGTPVTHVGIYCGNGIMLHCGDPIKYSSIYTSYWQSHFYGFGRL